MGARKRRNCNSIQASTIGGSVETMWNVDLISQRRRREPGRKRRRRRRRKMKKTTSNV